MLVDAIRLRGQGVKLTPDQRDSPIRGVLRMSYWLCSGTAVEPAGRIRQVRLMSPGADHPPYTGTLFPCLQRAEVMQLRDGAMVIVGIESIHEREGRGRWPQAWWCRVVAGDGRAT